MATPWLENKNLQKWLKTPVKEILFEGGNAKGENYMSTMKKLTVKAEDGRSFPLIVKCKLSEGAAADYFQKSDIFRKEVEFYGNTVHALQDILREAYPDEEPIAPECYYACEDFLVLEDLTPSGFRTENRRVGLNLEQCQLVMRTLAKFHAASVILHERNPRTFDKFMTNFYQEPSLQEPFKLAISGMALTLAEELETWDEEWHKYIPKLKLFAENSIARVRENSTRIDTDFNVLVHADVWTNNILFRDGTAGIRFVDFQVTHYSSPALDLHYFLATSPAVDVRANHIDSIIKEYHESLSHSLLALGYSKHIPTLEELHQEIDKKSLFGLYAFSCPYAVMQCDPECGFSYDDILARGTTPGPSMFDDTYKKNIKVLLPWLAVKGAFEIGL